MLKKTILAAATIAMSMVAFQPAAQAGNVHFQVKIGNGYGGGGHWGGGYWGGPYKLSCWDGKRKLRYRGYHHINPTDCYGKYYSYRVVRKGKVYRIRMNAFNGHYSRHFVGYI